MQNVSYLRWFREHIAKLYIYVFANLLLSLWCYSLENKCNLLETHLQIRQPSVSITCQVKDTFHTGSHTNVECFTLWQNKTCKTDAFQYCQCEKLRSRVQICAFFRVQYPLILTGNGSYISTNVSSPSFSANSDTVTAYLLESPLGARFKKFCLLFYKSCVFAGVQTKNGNVLLLFSGLFSSSSMKGAKSSYSAETYM